MSVFDCRKQRFFPAPLPLVCLSLLGFWQAMPPILAQKSKPLEFSSIMQDFGQVQDEYMRVTEPKNFYRDVQARAKRVNGRLVNDLKNLVVADNDSGHLNLAQKYKEALVLNNEILQLQPENAQFLASRSSTYSNLGEYDKSIVDATHALKIDPRSHLALRIRMYCYMRLKQYEKGIADCDRLIAIDPAYGHAYFNRSKAYEKLGRLDLARQDMARVRELGFSGKDELENVRPVLGQDQASGRLSEANHQILVFPTGSTGYLSRGKLYYGLGKWNEALADLLKAREINPDYGNMTVIQIAHCYLNLDRPQDAVKWLSANPDRHGAGSIAVLRAQINESLGRYDEALRDYTAVIERNDANSHCEPLLLVWRAHVYEQIKQPAKALADCERALSRDPMVVGGRLLRGSAKEQLGDLETAFHDYSYSIAKFPEDKRAYVRRANLLMDRRRFKDALNDLTEALRFPVGDPIPLYEARAQCYDALNDAGSAAKERAIIEQLRAKTEASRKS